MFELGRITQADHFLIAIDPKLNKIKIKINQNKNNQLEIS